MTLAGTQSGPAATVTDSGIVCSDLLGRIGRFFRSSFDPMGEIKFNSYMFEPKENITTKELADLFRYTKFAALDGDEKDKYFQNSKHVKKLPR